MKRWRSLILLLVLAALFWNGRDFVLRSSGTWPAIRNPGELVSDCEQLLRATQSHAAITTATGLELPVNEWPASISALRPRSVTLYPGTVDIFLSTGGIGSSFGYLVAPAAAEPAVFRRYFTTRLYKPGIYFWESQT